MKLKQEKNKMTSINPINVNSQGIGAASGFGTKPKAEKEEAKKEEMTLGGENQKPVSADKVLDFLAANSVAVTTKQVDPSKYVDKASADRIASFMSSFEDKVAEGLAAFDKEFGGVQVSDSAKMAVVLGQVEKDLGK